MFAFGILWFHLAIPWSMVRNHTFRWIILFEWVSPLHLLWSNSAFLPSHSFSVPLPWERGHCAAVRSQTAAADHRRQKGLCVRVRHPPEAAAPYFPGPWLSHQGPCTGCLWGLLRHRLCRGQHEGDACSNLPKHINTSQSHFEFVLRFYVLFFIKSEGKRRQSQVRVRYPVCTFTAHNAVRQQR